MKQKIFAECNGELYLDMKYTGIHPLVILADGLTITTFSRSNKPYLRVSDVIDWHDEEFRVTKGRNGDVEVVVELIRIHSEFKNRRSK